MDEGRSGNYDVINAFGLEIMDAILLSDASLGKRVEHIGSAEDEEIVKDKV